MNPQVMSSSPESNGHENQTVGARTVIIPEDLLDAVDEFPFITPACYPDRKEMIHLYRTTGITKGEMATLSEENLYPNKFNFDSIQLMDKPDCPTKIGIGFQVKTHNRHKRIIPLTDRAIKFLKSQMEKHKYHDVYGYISVNGDEPEKLVKYQYLLPIYRDSKWVRCDDFIGGIQKLFERVGQHFKLGYCGSDYTVHDFRNTLNERMGDAGISAEDRAYILGHSKEVNERNYMNAEKRKELRAKMALPTFREKMLGKILPPQDTAAQKTKAELHLTVEQ